MFTLARMLLTQKLRKQRRQYGVYLVLTVAALLLLVLWKLSSIFAHVLAFQAPSRLGAALQAVWIGWAAMGILTGRDLTWHIRIERLTVFRKPFGLLYALDLLLSVVAYPMFIVFGIVFFYGARTGWPLQHWAAAVAGLLCFVWTIRLVVSVARTLLHRREALSAAQRIAGSAVLVCGAAAMFAWRVLSPGHDLAAVLLHGTMSTALPAVLCALLALDYWLQRRVVYSGLAESVRLASFGRAGSAFVVAGGTWPSTAWRIAMLGWLRNTNVVLLLLWGIGYGFVYTWFQKTTDVSYFLMFIWAMLIFHSWVRANLFGIDHKAAWLYFALPVRPERVVAAKTVTMTLFQALMIAAVLLPGILHPTAVTTPLQWACVLGFAVSGILVSEILGAVFSLLHPEPIERGAMYSGAMTVGAFVIPGAELLLVVVYGLVHALGFRIPIATRWIIYLGIPLFLLLIRWRAMPVFVEKLVASQKDDFLNKLDAVTP